MQSLDRRGILQVEGAEAQTQAEAVAEDVSEDTAQKVAMFAVSSVGCTAGYRL